MAAITFKKNNIDVVGLTLTPADFVDGEWHSDEMTMQNASRLTLNARYANLSPDGSDVATDYRLKVAIQGREDDGTFVTLVNQFTPQYRSESAATRRLIVSDTPPAYNPSENHIIADGLDREMIEVSAEQDDIPDKVKVCLVLDDADSGNPGLTSFQITLTGRVV